MCCNNSDDHTAIALEVAESQANPIPQGCEKLGIEVISDLDFSVGEMFGEVFVHTRVLQESQVAPDRQVFERTISCTIVQISRQKV